ncbi:MAG: hypothetical protein [Podoviridae sp. ctrTa16]|nr:MAG: hypothetical protein [Podoviridae sp. ctrTa16]
MAYIKFSEFPLASPSADIYFAAYDSDLMVNKKISYSNLLSSIKDSIVVTPTQNYLSKFNAAGNLVNSLVYDNGTSVGIGTSTDLTYTLNVRGVDAFSWGYTSGKGVLTTISGDPVISTFTTGLNLRFYAEGLEAMRITSGKNVLIGTTTDAGYKLNVNGNVFLNSGNLSSYAFKWDNNTASGVWGATTRAANRAHVFVNGWSPTINTFVIKNAGSQSADTLRLENSSDAVMSAFFYDGSLSIGSGVNAGYKLDVVGGDARIRNIILSDHDGFLDIKMIRAAGAWITNSSGIIKFYGTNATEINGRVQIQGSVRINSDNDNTDGLYILPHTINTKNKGGTNDLYIGSSETNRLKIFGASGNFLISSAVSSSTTDTASAILRLDSTTKGFLPPRMTGAQAEAISTPAAGILVYADNGNGTTITSIGWWGYNGTTWVKLN